ncbi:hypothetical protein [Arenivirga flava]|uniref:Uncharacterized protein n=1 Tax=Arenivirga flava TaxID=1930060 RepID=A0AA37XBQ4_9MICO|nr:hypothetical protein [Arenivirga flava]GMA28858.1 hypothetical protein GCM10025874_21110 [Arenivirga flava]
MLTTLTAPATTHRTVAASNIDNRPAYLAFAASYLLGHGGTALTIGAKPVLGIPPWIPVIALVAGILGGTAFAIIAATRAQHGLTAFEARPAKLLGLAWITGFTGLFFAITGLSANSIDPSLQSALWPAGSALVVGLISIAEGAARRDTIHYVLGTFLVLLAGATLLLPAPASIGVLAVLGGSGYVVAALQVNRTRQIRL